MASPSWGNSLCREEYLEIRSYKREGYIKEKEDTFKVRIGSIVEVSAPLRLNSLVTSASLDHKIN